MAIVPRMYSDEFKRDAVALVNSGLSQKQVCRDLGVSKSALQTWVKDDRFRALGFTPTTDVEERREIVENHDGDVTMASTLGEGSTVTVTLPLRR